MKNRGAPIQAPPQLRPRLNVILMIGPAIIAPSAALTFIADSRVPAISCGPKAVSRLLLTVVNPLPSAKMTKDNTATEDSLERPRSSVPIVSRVALPRTSMRSFRVFEILNVFNRTLLAIGISTKSTARVTKGRMAKRELAYIYISTLGSSELNRGHTRA